MGEKEKKVTELVKEHLHYLKVLEQNDAVFQPEVRHAIEYAIKVLNLIVLGD